MEEIESWKDVLGYDGVYQISNFGNVKTLTRKIIDGKRIYVRRGKILNKYPNKDGYYTVKLYNGDASFVSSSVHRLVAQAFIPNIENKPQINHIDGHPPNNYYKNLEWCTNSENTKHAYKLGLRDPSTYKGSGNSNSKLTEQSVFNIREEYIKNKTPYRILAEKYKVGTTLIGYIVNNKIWKHV